MTSLRKLGDMVVHCIIFHSEWKDGLLPHILRKYCAKTTASSQLQSENKSTIKVVLLDGECDPSQMEIMGSILHNDGTIVLGNNERIPMSGHVRFIWEVGECEKSNLTEIWCLIVTACCWAINYMYITDTYVMSLTKARIVILYT